MKRKITLLLLMLLNLMTLLAACSTPTTGKEIRWDAGEDYTFHISLADFVYNTEGQITGFNEYTSEAHPNVKFSKDMAMSGETISSLDEILPAAVDGTLNMKIDKNNSMWTLTTEQILYVQYLKEIKLNNGNSLKLTECDAWSDLQTLAVEGEELTEKAPLLQIREDCVVLKSVIKQSVTFKDEASQSPVKSSTDSNGFYLGAQRQQLSKYTVETTYDFSDKRPIAKVSVNGEEPTEYKLAKNAQFIDPIQLPLYLRSYDKTSNDFQDSPAVRMFNPLIGELQIMGFGLNYNMPMVLTDNSRDPNVKYTSLNVVTVTVGGMAYMVEENVPDYIVDANNVPIDKMLGKDPCKYTTVRFRVGYLAYELQNYQQKIWDGLKFVSQES